MPTRSSTEAAPPEERVHLEKCKICGEWINRLSLDDVVRHLDHSQAPCSVKEPAVAGSPPDLNVQD